MKLKAFVPQQIGDEVRWLILESDEDDTNGYFIYYYLNENKAYDSWYRTIEDAYKAAQSQYNIQKEHWKELNDI